MTENDDTAELLFFDTFSHEVDSDINLDLVQFPKPVYITQVRIIPLGARVQADFPGGVRLGATNPSKFGIEFFVNDLGMPGASAFENLGSLEYNQNDCIHLECNSEKIPTDGLVLRGWYSTITLAVYGILTNTVTDQIASPPPPPCEPAPPEEVCNISLQTGGGNSLAVLPVDEPIKSEWKEPLPGEAHPHSISKQPAEFDRDEVEFATSAPPPSALQPFNQPEDDRERRIRKTSHSSERSSTSRVRTYSESNEREYINRQQQQKSSRDWSRSPEYRHSRRTRSDRSRSDADSAEQHKWQPRTPPHSHAIIDSPTRPRSPDLAEVEDSAEAVYKIKPRGHTHPEEPVHTVSGGDQQTLEDEETPGTPGGEQFEPILSDDEIIGDDDSSMPEIAVADEVDLEIEAAAALCGTAIKHYDPYKMPLAYFSVDLNIFYAKEVESLTVLFKKFHLQTKIENVTDFGTTTQVDERENFVYLCEQLINQLIYISQNYRKRYFVIKQFFKEQSHLTDTLNILRIALDFECACAQPQPAFKIRHIKIGARLTELLAFSKELFAHMVEREQIDPFQAVFALYRQDYMALSIKLMLLRAIYSLLDTREGVYLFLNSKLNGYQYVVDTLQQTHLTRPKFALKSIIKKLNLNEALESIRENCTKQFVLVNFYAEENFSYIEHAIGEVITSLAADALCYQQPKRFLPFSKKFEMVSDASAHRSWANALQAYLGAHSLCESILLIFSNQAAIPISLLSRTLDLLEVLLQQHVGIDYFVDDCFETTQALVCCLLGTAALPLTSDGDKESPPPNYNDEESNQEIEEDSKKDVIEELTSSVRAHRIGLELAYKVQTRYHIDAIVYSAEYDTINLTTHLHELYSQTCNHPGLQHTVEVIGLNNQLQPFLDLIEKERHLQAQRQLSSPGSKYKSPVLSYAVDIVDCCVRHCENLDYLIEHGTTILELTKNHETYEPSVSAVLQEMFVYLKPLEAINIFAYDDITPLVEVITRSLEYITMFPGDLIMGLRILRHLAIGAGGKAPLSFEMKELKHRYVALQFYAADGVQMLLQIFDKICVYFEQPGLHSPALMTIQGVHCCQILLPALQVLREMLSFAISCRDVEFRDLTAIDPLMKTYFLMHFVPAASPAADDAQRVRDEVIKILLAYTQPNEQDEESLHKSLWTQMIREVLKNVIDGPSTFIPGLQLLAELLPLPLPLPTSVQLREGEIQRLLTERKLWSAHLHPESALLARLIETIIPTSFPQLCDLLTRVCLQLSDLAPNMTLLVSKTVTELLIAEWTTAGGSGSPLLARMLHFFAELTAYASVKSSALSIFSGKLWELLQALLCATANSSKSNDLATLAKCQISVYRIFENFFDSEISLISPYSTTSPPEVNLASALPPKELIPRIIEAILTNLLHMEFSGNVSMAAARTLIILTEHDITYYHLQQSLKSKRTEFQLWLKKLVEVNEKGTFHGTIDTMVLFFRALTCIEDTVAVAGAAIPNRTLKMSFADLAKLIGFAKDTDTPKVEGMEQHILKRIRFLLVEKQDEETSESLINDFDNLVDQLEAAVVSAMGGVDDEMTNPGEPFLPQTEGIVTQYAARPIFTVYDANVDEQQLNYNFWLDPIRVETMSKEDLAQCERIPCNLNEIITTYLPSETNLSSDCKRVLHLSASPQSNRERTPTAPCFRTRRVEVEPTTGRPEKKIYITPVRGRGFSRAPPSRGDLFRSRPPNTSRPPSLHVDDFLALETCGAQPTGPTGYNKIPSLMRGSRVGRNRGSRISSSPSGPYRKSKPLRTASPSPWNESSHSSSSQHFRTATAEPVTSHYSNDSHYSSSSSSSHFARQRGRGRIRTYLR